MYRFPFGGVDLFDPLSLLPLLLCGVGVAALIHYRSVLLSPVALFSPLGGKDKAKKKTTVKTLILALSGTLGVGNITGVAAALLIGGAGSVFWMLVSTPFAVALKYAESNASIRVGEGEGIPGVLKNALGKRSGAWLARIYVLVFLLLALVLGAAVQGNAILENTVTYIRVDRAVLSVFLIFSLAIAVFGKTDRIINVLSFTLPFATIVYIFLCFCVLIANASKIPTMIFQICTDAFEGVRPGLGGLVGVLTSNAIREGFSAGILSNEAGAGTSAFAHEYANNPRRAGAIGALEVIFDTVFLCTLSALTFLVGASTDGAGNAADVIERTFRPVFGAAYILPLLISITLLAVSSNLCYALYARRALVYARLEKWVIPYMLLFLASTGGGGLCTSTALVTLSHYLLVVLCALTSIAILASIKKKRSPKESAHPKITKQDKV